MSDTRARWRIWTDLPGATISPNLYGHFAEHLGRCIYEGIWVGTDSRIPNQDGFRSDTLEALRALPTPVIRWPGGCFADEYHWEDGIGPRARRRRGRNIWWHAEDSNHFGTDEFLAFSRLVGAEPYISANVGSGSPAEALNWLDYCNGDGTTHYAELRRRNGQVAPYNVRYWGVGNECWGCGGNFTAEEYAGEYRRFATYMRGRDAAIQLVAVGGMGGRTYPADWNNRFLAALGVEKFPRLARLIDHLSIHRYFRGPSDRGFTDAQYYDLAVASLQIEEDLRLTRDVLSYYVGAHKRIGIVVDEWGTWYEQAKNDNGLEQKNTLQDAIIAAATLNVFNRWADWVTMANLAQTINVLQCVIQTAEEKLWLTPTYHAFKLVSAHAGNQLLHDELATPELEVTPADGSGRSTPLPLVSASASRAPDGRGLVLTLVNRHLTDTIECPIELRGEARPDGGIVDQLADTDVRAFNSAAEPDRISPTRREIAADGPELAVALPPHSVTALRLRLG